MCFNKQDMPILFENLERSLDLKTNDTSLWNDKCDHYELNEIQNLNPDNKNLMLLQLNIRNLLGKQSDLNSLTDRLYQNRSLPKILLLSETHLTKSKMRHLKIQNYTIIDNNRTHKTGGRVAIAVHNTLTYSEHKDLNKLYNENFECIFIGLKQKS